MAQGDVVFFDQFLVDCLEGIHNLETNSIKIFLTTGATVLATTTSDPRYGAGGGTNLSSEEAPNGGNYATGGKALANPSVVLNGGLAEIDWDDPGVWSQHASNPTDVEYGVIYNDTAAGKQCIGYVDLGGTFNMTTGDLTITFATPAATLNQA